MSIAINILSKLVKNYGPKMGRVIHAVAEETGLRPRQVKRMMDEAGPLKSKFDFGTIFHHSTPMPTPSRVVAVRGGNPLEALKKGKTKGEHLVPFEEIKPSGTGHEDYLGPGTYLSRKPLFAFRMGTRDKDPRTGLFGRAIRNPAKRKEPSVVPYVLRKGWKGRMVTEKDYMAEAKKAGQGIEDYMMNRFFWYNDFPKYRKSKLPEWEATFRSIVPEKADRDMLTKMWRKSDKKVRMDRFGDVKDFRFYSERAAQKATRKALAQRGKIGIHRPTTKIPKAPETAKAGTFAKGFYPEEHVLFPGLEKYWMRHPLARFQNEIGGTFASLLPLISMLRGKREE
jgi:hypothetical protein